MARVKRCRCMRSIGVSFWDSRDLRGQAAVRVPERVDLHAERVDLLAERGRRPGLRAGLALRHVLAPLAGPVPAGTGSSRRDGSARRRAGRLGDGDDANVTILGRVHDVQDSRAQAVAPSAMRTMRTPAS